MGTVSVTVVARSRYNGAGGHEVSGRRHDARGVRRRGEMNPVIERALREQLDQLPADQQRQVLDFARALAVKKHATASGKALRTTSGLQRSLRSTV